LALGESDGILSFDEIAGLDLDANLVFLAACDTAVGIEDEELARSSGQEEASGSLEGLVRAFLTANARAVVATSWVAPDGETTRSLIRSFYEKGRTSDVGAALREGQLKLMRDPVSSHPYRWGSFFVVGDASKPLVSTVAAAAMSKAGPLSGAK
jgi:CHAT domain-containing protein